MGIFACSQTLFKFPRKLGYTVYSSYSEQEVSHIFVTNSLSDFPLAVTLLTSEQWRELRIGRNLPQYSSEHTEFACSALTNVTTPYILLHITGRSDTMTGQQSIVSTLPSSLRHWPGRRLCPLPMVYNPAWINKKSPIYLHQGDVLQSLTPFSCSSTPNFLCFESEKNSQTSRSENCVSASLAIMSHSVAASRKQLRHTFHISPFSVVFLLLLYLRVGVIVVVTSESSLLLCNVEGRDQRL